jgi:hypothetical protein
MATQVQFRRGTTTQNNAFTGAIAEITYDTEAKTLRLHDGTTAGGGATVATLAGTQTLTNKTLSTNSVWQGSPIGLAFGGTNANLAAAAGSVAYSTASAIGLTAVGTSGQVLTSGGTSAPTWTAQSSLTVGTATTATTATNINGGSAGNLVYQIDTNQTGFIAPGQTGFVLQSTGASTPPSWVTSDITIGSTSVTVGTTETSFAGLNVLASSGTSHWTLPAGTVEQRPESPAVGMVRYNTDQSSFEGYASGAWSSLGGVKSVNGFTFIQAETSAGAANGDLDFFAENLSSNEAEQVGQWNTTNLKDYTGTIVGTQTTQNVFNATATTVNAFGAATTLTLGATSGTATIRNSTVAVTNNATVGGTLGVTGTTTLGDLTIGSNKTISMGSNKITNVDAPSASTDAANKQYVDEVAQGLKAAPAAEVATTANLPATYDNGTAGVGATLTATSNGAFPAIDGVTVATTTMGLNGVLVKNQTNPAHNGRYNLTQVGNGSTPWILTRCSVCDQASEIPGSYVFIKGGSTQANTGWVAFVANPSTFTVGTDNITFFQFSGAGTFTAGTGLTLTGTQFSVNASQTQITALGTIGTGTWQGSIISPTYGGTGVNNGTRTITLGGNFTHSGAHTLTLTTTGNTSVTLPTSGTLVNTARAINTSTGLTGGGDLSADRSLALTGQALALHNLGTNGIIARTGAGTVAARTITAGTGITVSNGDGVSGNPTISIPQAVATTSNVQFGSLGVGTAASGTAGEIRATNQITSFFSDERLKQDIKTIENAVDKVKAITGVTYKPNALAESFGYKGSEELVGVIAQQVEAVMPQVVKPAPFDRIQIQEGVEISRSGENYKTVQYDKLVPLLIQAIKEQQVMIEELQKKVGK